MFREIGLADELGSGMRNTYKYTQLYSGQSPVFEEGDVFKTIIPLKKIVTQKVGGNNTIRSIAQNVTHGVVQNVAHDVAQNVTHGVVQNVAQNDVHGVAQNVTHGVAQEVVRDKVVLVEFIKEKVRSNDKITRKAIADEVGVSVKTIERAMKGIYNLKYVGTGRNGRWELNE